MTILIAGCSGTRKSTVDSSGPVSIQEAASTDDKIITEMLDQYRDGYDKQMGVKVANVEYALEFGKPESRLGNLVADAIRFRAARETRSFVHLSVIGGSSFRLNLKEGELSLGEVLEFMPYENHLVVLKLSGEMVYELSQQIADRGGAPISGMRFRIIDGEARQVLVNSEILEKNREYWLATSSWVADGGDQFTAITDPLERIDYDLSIRQLYIDFFKNRRTLAPELDGRIR